MTDPFEGHRTHGTRLGATLLAASTIVACGPGLTEPGAGTSSGGSATEPAASSIGESTQAIADTTADSTGAPPLEGWCLRGPSTDHAPLAYLLTSGVDTNDDGREEAWTYELVGSSTQLQATQQDPRGLPIVLAELERDGRALAMADVDADGRVDLIMTNADESEHWWLAGLPDSDFDSAVQPMSGVPVDPPLPGWWLDLDGDGAVDHVERQYDGPRIHMGDGAGGLSETDVVMPGYEVEQTALHPVRDTPGSWILRLRELVGVSLTGPDTVQAITVSPAGAVDVLATIQLANLATRHAEDLDGDGQTDVLGFVSTLSDEQNLRRLKGQPGTFAVHDYEIEAIDQLVVGDFDGDGTSDLLYWDTQQTWIRWSGTDDATPPEPVSHDGVDDLWRDAAPLQADGVGGDELLQHWVDEAELGHFQLLRLEPC